MVEGRIRLSRVASMSGRQAVSSPERRRGRARREEPGAMPPARPIYSGAWREGKPGPRRRRRRRRGAGRPPPAPGAATAACSRQNASVSGASPWISSHVSASAKAQRCVSTRRACADRLGSRSRRCSISTWWIRSTSRRDRGSRPRFRPGLPRLHPPRPPGWREAQRHDQAAEQDAVGEDGRRRVEARPVRVEPGERRPQLVAGLAVQHLAQRLQQADAVQFAERALGGARPQDLVVLLRRGGRARPCAISPAGAQSRRGRAGRPRTRAARQTTPPAACAPGPRENGHRDRRCSGRAARAGPRGRPRSR